MTNRILEHVFGRQSPNGQGTATDNDTHEVGEATVKQAKQLLKEAENVVISHPVAALSVAIVAGVAVGWWVKRK